MSQYPSPYQAPSQGQYGVPPVGYGYPMGGDPGGAGRRAGVLMFVLGGLGVLGGLCCGVGSVRLVDLLMQRPEFAQQMPPEVTTGMVKVVMVIVAGVWFVYGAGLMVLGVFVRKSAKPAIVISIVLTVLSLLYLAFVILKALVGGGQPGEAAGGVCVAAVPAGLYTLLLVWLVQALRNVAAVRAAGDYARQYWQYAQQQQAYQQQQQAWQQQQQGGGAAQPPAGQGSVELPPQVPPVPPPTFGAPPDKDDAQ